MHIYEPAPHYNDDLIRDIGEESRPVNGLQEFTSSECQVSKKSATGERQEYIYKLGTILNPFLVLTYTEDLNYLDKAWANVLTRELQCVQEQIDGVFV